MSVFFTGASGQGKTTLASLLSDHTDWYVVDGIVRRSPYALGTDENQQYVSKEVFRASQAYEGIHCRTPLDVAGYTKAYKSYSPCDEQYVKDFLSTSPIIIYFPMVLDIKDDGFRPTDRELNSTVDKWIRSYLREYDVEYLTLKKESPEARLQAVLEYLEERGVSIAKEEAVSE